MADQRIEEIATTRDDVLAFRVPGGVARDEMARMAEIVNRAFDTHDTVDLLLELTDVSLADGLADGLAAASGEVLRSMVRSLSNVRRYAVIGAPAAAAAMIEAMDTVTPTEARAFHPSEAHEAWAFVGAAPRA